MNDATFLSYHAESNVRENLCQICNHDTNTESSLDGSENEEDELCDSLLYGTQ